jgi:hypothetical protein
LFHCDMPPAHATGLCRRAVIGLSIQSCAYHTTT